MTYKIFQAKTEVLSDALCFVDQMLDNYECPMRDQTAVCVAIEDVFVNIAHYAYADSDWHMTLGIGFDKESGSFSFRITFKGVPCDALKKLDSDVTLSVEEHEIVAPGIVAARKYMNSVIYAYENGENILTMTKSITAEEKI